MKSITKHFPIGATVLAELGTFAQMIRMLQQTSSDDQSLIGWMIVAVALMMWYIWWITTFPEEKLPRYCAAFGVFTKVLGIGLIIYLRL